MTLVELLHSDTAYPAGSQVLEAGCGVGAQTITLALEQVNWPLIGSQIGNIGTIIMISVVSLLLNASGMEIMARRDIDLNHELQSAGLANLVAGLGGGPAGYHALSLSALGHRVGASTRLVGLLAGGLCGVMLFFGASIISFFPKLVLGGLLLFLGLAFVVEWCTTLGSS